MNENNYCRMCLSTNNLYPIFQYPDKNKKYTSLLYLATGLKIQYGDKFSQSACTVCINIINNYVAFRQTCFATYSKLIGNIKAFDTKDVCEEAENIECDSSDNNLHFNVNYENKDDNCEEKGDIQSNSLTEFEMTVEESLNAKVHLEFENITSKRKVKLKYSDTEPVNVKQLEANEKQPTGPMECTYCNKILKTKMSLSSHYKIHKGRNIICEHCGRKFSNKRQLIVHCRSKHGYEKTDKCAYCDYRGCNAELVKIHERIHTGERPYVCSVCGAAFHRRSTYLQHVPTHLPDKTVPCPECPALFKSVTLMRIHRSRHRKPRERARAAGVHATPHHA